MKKKYSFPEPTCRWDCDQYLEHGNLVYETRYCLGVKRKDGKRFRRSDPQHKAPRWCPKRLAVPVCRVYGFADERSEYFELLERQLYDPAKHDYHFPMAPHYKLRLELPLGMKAKDFWEAAQNQNVVELLPDADLQYGEIIEIDDGLKPYAFYYFNWSTLIPIYSFDRGQTANAEVRYEK